MTKNVRINIVGIQIDTGEEAVTTRANGTYHLQNGNHYIQYEETSGEKEITKSLIKITPEEIIIKRSGSNNSHMVFTLTEATRAQYQTPYGVLMLHVLTTALKVTQLKDELLVTMEYTLSENNSELSKNRILMSVVSMSEPNSIK